MNTKVIKKDEGNIYIGYENGSIEKISIQTLDFDVEVGDVLDFHAIDGKKVFKKISKRGKFKTKNLVSLILLLFVLVSMSSIIFLYKNSSSNNKVSEDESSYIKKESSRKSYSTSDKLDKLLKDNDGNSILIKAGKIKRDFEQTDHYMFSEIKDLEIDGVKYGREFEEETIEIGVLFQELGTPTNEDILIGEIKSDGKEIFLEITDYFTPDLSFDDYLSNRVQDDFEVLGKIRKITEIDDLGIIADIDPYWLDIVDDEKDKYSFGKNQSLSLIISSEAIKDITDGNSEIKIDDELHLFGTIYQPVGVDTFYIDSGFFTYEDSTKLLD